MCHIWGVPELPEVAALASFLDERARGRTVERCELAAIAALKTFDPPLEALIGRSVTAVQRRGKFICTDLDGTWLVLHLARGGWVKWWDMVPAKKGRPGRSPLALRLAFDDGAGFDVTEMGTEKRLAAVGRQRPACHRAPRGTWARPSRGIVHGGRTGRRPGGDDGQHQKRVGKAVGHRRGRERVFRRGASSAHLSPFKTASKLNPQELERLHSALVGVLGEAVDARRAWRRPSCKGDKKRFLRVHGRTGERCPECGDVIREVSFATQITAVLRHVPDGGKALGRSQAVTSHQIAIR